MSPQHAARHVRAVPIMALVGIALTALPAASVPAGGPMLAVAVHPRVPVEDISVDRLRRIFMGDQQYWSDGSKIVVLIHAQGTMQRERTLRVLLRMTEAEYKQFWIARIFRGEVTSGPRVVPDASAMVELVRTIPGAIAVTLQPDDESAVKILAVDGKRPGDTGYLLRP